MGANFASDLAECVADNRLNLETALLHHFQSNHYPPLPAILIPAAIAAIDLAQCEEWDDTVDLPEGITWRGQSSAPVRECVQAWHLVAFIQIESEE